MKTDANKDEDTPLIHFWLPFGKIKPIYPLDKNVKVTKVQLEKEDQTRWVEIPDDYVKRPRRHLMLQ